MRYLFLIILSGFSTCALAQRHRRVYISPSPKEILKAEIASRCFFTNRYSALNRRGIYPFSKAKNVMLVSFKYRQGAPVRNKIINEQILTEKSILSVEQIDSLTSIIYNVGYTPVEGAIVGSVGANCFEPRNAILFIDAAGKAFEYMEICFACDRTEKSSNRFNDGQYCSTKYDLLRDFFNSAGIKNGTENRDSVLSYNKIFKLDTAEMLFALQNKLANKSKSGLTLDSLNPTERVLFLTIASDGIYNEITISKGLTEVLLNTTGKYYLTTLASLKEIGAYKIFSVLDSVKQQWPQQEIPQDDIKRRDILLTLVNTVSAKWDKFDTELIIHDVERDADERTTKEDLYGLIVKYAMSHRDQLVD